MFSQPGRRSRGSGLHPPSPAAGLAVTTGALIALLAVFSLSFAFIFATPAGASSPDHQAGGAHRVTLAVGAAPSTQSGLICGSSSTTSSVSSGSNDLPANRWSGAIASQHTRLDSGFLGLGDIGQVIQRNVVVGGAMSIGATEWKLGIGATEMANQFCFAKSVGNVSDKVAGGIGNAIDNAGILAALVVIALLVAIWRLSRGQQRQWGKFFRVILIVGIFVAITSAAASTTTKSKTATPPPMSPGWLVEHVYNTVSDIANGPVQAFSSATQSNIGAISSTTVANQDPLDCYWYTTELVKKYEASFGPGDPNYSVPVALNSLWEASAIPAYTDAQFGGSNNFGPLVYCHLLEDQAGVRPYTQLAIERATGKTSGYPTSIPLANAWNGARSNTSEDESMVGWAACQSTSARPLTPTEWDLTNGAVMAKDEWTIVKNPNRTTRVITPRDCEIFWTVTANGGGQYGTGTSSATATATASTNPFVGPPTTWKGQVNNPDYSPFNWTTNTQNVTTAANKAGTTTMTTGAPAGNGFANFIDTLHGTSNGDAIAMAIIFAFASTIVMIVFLVLAAALMIAKIALLVSIILLPVMLALAVFPNSYESKLGQYLKHTMSLILFACFVGVLIGLVALITSFFSDIGSSALGHGSLLSVLWIAISPVGALFTIHHFFKKVLKAPSPFNPKAALAYGAAAGGFAGGAEAGVLSLATMRRTATNQARRARSGIQNRRNRKQGMTPDGDGDGDGDDSGPQPTRSSGPGRNGQGRRTQGPSRTPPTTDERRESDAWNRDPTNARSKIEEDALKARSAARAAAVGAVAGIGGGLAAGAVATGRFARHPAQHLKAASERLRTRSQRRSAEKAAGGESPEGRRSKRLSPRHMAAATWGGVKTSGRVLRRGSMAGLTVAGHAAAASGSYVARHPVKTAKQVVKYGAVGATIAGLTAFPPLAGAVAGGYAIHKIRQHTGSQARRARSNRRLDRYREAQRQQSEADRQQRIDNQTQRQRSEDDYRGSPTATPLNGMDHDPWEDDPRFRT